MRHRTGFGCFDHAPRGVRCWVYVVIEERQGSSRSSQRNNITRLPETATFQHPRG